MIFYPGSITDNTIAQEWNPAHIANLCNGTRFHVYRHSFRKTFFDLRQLLFIGNKLIPATYQTTVNITLMSNRQCQFTQLLIRNKTSRQTLHLTIFISFPTPHVMINHILAHNNIHHLCQGIYPSRYPGIDNNIRCVTLYHFHRTDSSTYLSNTAFNQDNLHVPDMSFREKKPANRFLFCLFQ